MILKTLCTPPPLPYGRWWCIQAKAMAEEEAGVKADEIQEIC